MASVRASEDLSHFEVKCKGIYGEERHWACILTVMGQGELFACRVGHLDGAGSQRVSLDRRGWHCECEQPTCEHLNAAVPLQRHWQTFRNNLLAIGEAETARMVLAGLLD